MPKLHPIAALIVCSTLLPACMAPAPTPQTRPQLTVKPHSEVRNTPGATVEALAHHA